MSNGRKTTGRVRQARAAEQKRRAQREALAPLVALAAALILAAGGFTAWQVSVPRPSTAIGGSFQMTDQDDRPADQRVLDGKWTAVFFGYTYCPNVCPATLQALGQARRRLGERGKDLQVVFVTVDPERDSAKTLKAYLAEQDIPVPTIGLTGTPAQVAQIAKAYGVYYAKVGTGSTYAMDHSSTLYLMDPSGRFVAPLSAEMTPDKIASEILKAERRA
jgi:protein SCO1/2